MEDNGAKLMELMNAHNAVLFVCGYVVALGQRIIMLDLPMLAFAC